MNKKGLTLIELIAVLAVIGLLALIIIPNTVKLIRGSKNDSASINENGIKQAANIYLIDNVSLESGESVNVTLSQLVEGGYLTGELIDSKTGKEYDLYNSIITITKDGNNYFYKMNLNTK